MIGKELCCRGIKTWQKVCQESKISTVSSTEDDPFISAVLGCIFEDLTDMSSSTIWHPRLAGNFLVKHPLIRESPCPL